MSIPSTYGMASVGPAGQRLNVEFKARLDRSLDEVEAALRSFGAVSGGVLSQRDTYFHTSSGRLKLREVNDAAELIDYARDERRDVMVSRYTVAALADAEEQRATLSARHGLRGVVEKVRRLWLYQNTRIHLDEVASLGRYIEIEVVEPATAAEGEATLAKLLNALALDPAAALRQSYIDLLIAAGAARPTLPDLLSSGLNLVFIGINPSVYSAERGQYFARPSNRFWPLLNGSGLLPPGVGLGPADGARLLDLGIGLTDVVSRATPSIADLTPADYAEGRLILPDKLLHFAPRAVCFVGKAGYEHFRSTRCAAWGRQPEPLGVTAVFVMPSTSGRANGLQSERISTLIAAREYLRA